MAELSVKALLQTSAGQEWLQSEYIRAQQLVEAAAQELQGLKGQAGERALRIFYRSLVQYSDSVAVYTSEFFKCKNYI